MDYILNPLLSYLLLYKYVALFIFIYSAAVILPLPSNAMLLAVGAFASQGYFSFWPTLATAIVANVLGDITDYGLARKYGERIIRILKLDRHRFFDALKEELQTDAAITVFTTRFAGSLGPVASILAGFVGVSFATFILYDFLGDAIEPFGAMFLGYIARNYWNDFSSFLGIIAGIFAVGIVIFVLVRIYRRITGKYSRK